MNPTLRNARFRFIVAMTVLAALDIAAAVFLLSPDGQGRAAWLERRDSMQQQLKDKRRDAAPLSNIEARLLRSKHDAAALVNSRFAEAQSQVSGALTKLASDAKVQIDSVNYKEDGTDIPSVDALTVQTNVTGDYEHIVGFINALERQKTMFVIDSVALSGQQQGTVKVGLQLQTFLRRRSG